MANKTLATLTAGAAIALGDLFLSRQGSDTEDKSVTADQIRDVVSNNIRRPMRVVTAAGAVTVLDTEEVIIIKKTSGAATAVNLPAGPETGKVYNIKDGKGDAGTNNITITPSSGNINGSATYVISTNYGAAEIVYTGTEWFVI
jgi:hypothetical protein